MTELCREYEISRKTGYKFLRRFERLGLQGLQDQSTAPHRVSGRTSPEIRELLIKTKKAHLTWGPKKLKAWLEAKREGLVLPSTNTIEHWLRREGLVKKRGRRRRATCLPPSKLTAGTVANEVWCADYKGQFKLANGTYCYPLTITDLHSRFLIACTALESTKAEPAMAAFEEAFREYGLPQVIRTDNGCPFASTGLAGFSMLSVRWLRLGIRPERIQPSHPEQNGQHERMHRTLKQETARPAGANLLQQQERFDEFRREFNEERPHEALGLRPPATLYVPSDRSYPTELPEFTYPLHDLTRTVSSSGMVWIQRRPVFLARALAGEFVGLREIEDGRWLVSYATEDLGYYDRRTNSFERRDDE
jgi:transposase InsO family protein